MSVKQFLTDYSKQNPHKMTVATEYKGYRVVAKTKDTSLMDSNWIHGPSGQNGGAAPKMVLEISTVLMILDDSDISWT
jgi:hypothetical protein